jgi:hypothetical protein
MTSIKIAVPLAFFLLFAAAGCSDQREQQKFQEKVHRLQQQQPPISSRGLNRRMK